jgi:serine O-acetyltransferase
LALFLARLNLMLNGCDIYPNAIIGPGFLIGHPTGVVIGRSTIGSNFRIQQNATLGVRGVWDDPTNFLADGEFNPASYPTLADNVTVCAGAVVLGNIKIGRGAMIGANAVVLQDVPEDGLAVGVPARIIEKQKIVSA